jgi:hypothetical protein
VIEGLRDGTIDAIASDHAPWDQDSKRLPFSSAAYGIVGLETLLPLSLELYHNRHLGLLQLIQRLTWNPARILRVSVARLAPGAPADLVLFDPDVSWHISTDEFRRNSRIRPLTDACPAGATHHGRTRTNDLPSGTPECHEHREAGEGWPLRPPCSRRPRLSPRLIPLVCCRSG